MRTLKKLIKWFWDMYPRQPLVYICTHNGVTGAVSAQDFDDEIRSMRRMFKQHGWPKEPVRPRVWPVFLFSDKTPGKINFRVGTMAEMKDMLTHCVMEYRDFELPPLNGPAVISMDYYGGVFQTAGYEDSKHRHYKFVDAWRHLTGRDL